MQKIPTLFVRHREGRNSTVCDEVTTGCEWVIAGEGVATRKLDGTCCLVRDGILYKRYDAKNGKVPPSNFEPAQEPDTITGHWPGWVPVGDGHEDRWHREAWVNMGCEFRPISDGTYELVGPKVQGNPDDFSCHWLVRHGGVECTGVPRDWKGLREYLRNMDIEGVVWHHPDGRMVKIKGSDFGWRR